MLAITANRHHRRAACTGCGSNRSTVQSNKQAVGTASANKPLYFALIAAPAEIPPAIVNIQADRSLPIRRVVVESSPLFLGPSLVRRLIPSASAMSPTDSTNQNVKVESVSARRLNAICNPENVA